MPAQITRRQRGGEDEARRIRANGVDHVGAAGDVTAERAEGFRKRAFQHVDPVHLAIARADAGAARAVHADRMHLVAIGHRIVLFGEVADRFHRRGVAVHRVEGLERDQLRPLARLRGEQLLEMRHVVVAPDRLLAAGLPHALDHRVVIQASDRIKQFGSSFAIVAMPVWFDT